MSRSNGAADPRREPAESVHDFLALHHSENFQAVFAADDSSLAVELGQLRNSLLTRRSMTESERIYNQGKLAGILAVRDHVAQMARRLTDHESPMPSPSPPRDELRFFPRSLRGERSRDTPTSARLPRFPWRPSVGIRESPFVAGFEDAPGPENPATPNRTAPKGA